MYSPGEFINVEEILKKFDDVKLFPSHYGYRLISWLKKHKNEKIRYKGSYKLAGNVFIQFDTPQSKFYNKYSVRIDLLPKNLVAMFHIPGNLPDIQYRARPMPGKRSIAKKFANAEMKVNEVLVEEKEKEENVEMEKVAVEMPKEHVEKLKEIAEKHGWKILIGGLILALLR